MTDTGQQLIQEIENELENGFHAIKENQEETSKVLQNGETIEYIILTLVFNTIALLIKYYFDNHKAEKKKEAVLKEQIEKIDNIKTDVVLLRSFKEKKIQSAQNITKPMEQLIQNEENEELVPQ